MSLLDFNISTAICGICRYEDQYLLLKIWPDYKTCPDSWDFVLTRISNDEWIDEYLLSYLQYHTNLIWEKPKQLPMISYLEYKQKTKWIILPFMVSILKQNYLSIKKSEKYIDYKWVRKENILEYDKDNYFKTYFDANIL